jgi:hypothetical protein
VFAAGQLQWCGPATAVLVEALLHRGVHADATEADAAIDRLEAASVARGWLINAIWPLRLRARLARAHGDDGAYRHYRNGYRAHGEIAVLRRAHDMGRGDAMTAVNENPIVGLGIISRELASLQL